MVILHTETCKKKKKAEKNYIHIYLAIFLNKLMISSKRLADTILSRSDLKKTTHAKENGG